MVKLRCGEHSALVHLTTQAGPRYVARLGERSFAIDRHGIAGQEQRISVDGVCSSVAVAWGADCGTLHLACGGGSYSFERILPGSEAAEGIADGTIRSPLAGRVASVQVEVGAVVNSGQPLLVLEAMKLETVVVSPCDGVIAAVKVAEADQVARGQVMIEIEVAAEEE